MSEIRQQLPDIDFPKLIEPVALRLLGPPSKATSGELRWGTNGSLSIDLAKGTWYDHENKVGGGCLALIERELGHNRNGGMKWLCEEGLLPPLNGGIVTVIPRQSVTVANRQEGRREEAAYAYHDADGTLLHWVIRYDPKSFSQCRPDPANPKRRIWNMDGVKQIPFQLPELLAAIKQGRTIYIVEGEKKATRLRALGLPATCCRGGAGKWCDELNQYLKDADVVILPDNDDTGRNHAIDVAKKLKGYAKSIIILHLPRL